MKGLRYMVAAVVGLAAIFSVNEAQAFGKGEMSVGLTGGFASYNESGYVSMNYQWECANHVRIAPEIGYIMSNDHKSGFMSNGDVHFPFQLVRGFGIYPLAGIAFNNWHYNKHYYEETNRSRMGVNVGLGFDVYFTNFFKMSLQGRYSIMPQTSGVFVGLGLSYVF